MIKENKFEYEYSLRSKIFELKNEKKITEKEYYELIKKLNRHNQEIFRQAFNTGYYAGYDACTIESICEAEILAKQKRSDNNDD